MPIVIAVVTAVCIAIVVLYIVRKIKRGGSCCGEHEAAARKVRAADKDISHYPYRYTIGIEGMVCSHCVRNVENAFNSAEDIFADVDLAKKTASVYSKHRLDRREAAAMLEGTTYTVTEFKEEIL